MANAENRLTYMDIAKGIGIVCVIVGHMNDRFIQQIVFSFHMPLFFIISGFFLPSKITPNELLAKRVKQLLPPYIATSIAIVLMSCFKNLIGILIHRKTVLDLVRDVCKWIYAAFYGAGSNHVTPFRVIQIGVIWLLLATIVSNYLVAKAVKTKYPTLFIVAIALVGYYTSKIVWLPWSIQAGMTAATFVYMGVILKRYNCIATENIEHFATAFAFWITEIIHGWPCIGVVENQYPNGAFDFIGGGAGAVCVIWIVKYIDEHMNMPIISRGLSWMGRNSMEMLCLHLFELNMIPWDKVLNFFGVKNNIFILIFTCKMLWAVVGTVLIEKIKKHLQQKENKCLA